MGDDERPAHDLKVAGFYLDRHEVTNAQFAMLIDATGYVTVGDRSLSNDDLPNLKT